MSEIRNIIICRSIVPLHSKKWIFHSNKSRMIMMIIEGQTKEMWARSKDGGKDTVEERFRGRTRQEREGERK